MDKQIKDQKDYTPSFISLTDISIERTAYRGLMAHCAKHRLNPRKLFIYYHYGEIVAGFSNNKLLHIQIHQVHWRPVHRC